MQNNDSMQLAAENQRRRRFWIVVIIGTVPLLMSPMWFGGIDQMEALFKGVLVRFKTTEGRALDMDPGELKAALFWWGWTLLAAVLMVVAVLRYKSIPVIAPFMPRQPDDQSSSDGDE